MNLIELKSSWNDTEDYHKHINDLFCQLVNKDQQLKEHRDYIESHAYGFGERAFHWLWKLLIDEMPKEFEFLEIGLYKGASLSLIGLIAGQQQKLAWRYGVSPLDNSDGYSESDYSKDIADLHDKFDIYNDYVIYKGLSTDAEIIEQANLTSPYDMVYIDGGHSYEIVRSDLDNYAPMVKSGGYLIMDDCNKEMHMPNGYFQGHESVSNAKRDWLEYQTDFEFVTSVVHISVFKRK